MDKLTLGEARASRIPQILGYCSDADEVRDYINAAVRRLINKGKWQHALGRYRICATSGQLTWPRAISSIEAFAICTLPGYVENGWYEFLHAGPGLQGVDDIPGRRLIDRGHAPVFTDLAGPNKKVQVVSTSTEASNSKILIRGYDDNKQWVSSTRS